MKETPIYSYYVFGYNYHILRAHAEGKRARGSDEHTLESSIAAFLENIDELGLTVTRHVASQLDELRGELGALPEDAVVDKALAARVRAACDALDATLDAELQLRTAYTVTPKRFALQHLLESPGELLTKDARTLLPQIARFDFAHACRCIAFNLPTAAAFHLMRSVEGALRAYYCHVVKRHRVSPQLWHPMIEHMRKRRTTPPRPLLDHLDHIRTNFRNPTQHPDKRYDLDEAQDLLAVCIDALNRLCRELAKGAT